jgi:hypothetical protein
MIVKIENSPIPHKRFRVFMDNGKHYDFGLDTGSTFIDHQNIQKRDNYIKRHLANSTERLLNENLVPSPSLFSMFLLWGKYPDLGKNIEFLNNLWKIKHKHTI